MRSIVCSQQMTCFAWVVAACVLLGPLGCSDAAPREDVGGDPNTDLNDDTVVDGPAADADVADDTEGDLAEDAPADANDAEDADLDGGPEDSSDVDPSDLGNDDQGDATGDVPSDVGDADDGATEPEASDDPDLASGDPDADEPDAPAVCSPTGEALHFWFGDLRNNVALTLAPDNPSALPLTSVDFTGDALLARYDDDCLTWVVRIARGARNRLFVDDASAAIYVVVGGGLGTPLEFLSPTGEVAASWPLDEEPLFRSSHVARYDFDGNLQWVRRLGPNSTSYTAGHQINGMHLTASGLRVVGYSPRVGNSNEPYDFVFGPGEDDELVVSYLLRHGTSFTALLDPATGNYVAGSAETIRPAALMLSRELRFTGQDGGQTDSQGNLALSGWFGTQGSWVFNPGEDDERALSTTSSAAFFVRYLANGDIDWLHVAADGASATASFGLAALSNGASIHGGSLGTGGLFEDSGDGLTLLGEGTLDAYMVRYSAAGVIEWLKPIRRLGNDGTNPRWLADEANDALYGFLAANVGVTFDQGEEFETTVTLGSAYETLLARFDLTTGAFVWARRIASNDRPTLGNLRIGPDGLEGAVWARNATTLNVGEADAVTVGVNGAARSVLARWDTDGNLLDIVPLASGTGVLPAFGYAVRVDLE